MTSRPQTRIPSRPRLGCDTRGDGFEVEHCYADYKGKKIHKEYWKEAGHGQQRKNW
ncbi:hypothetical protein Tco_0504240, partial [Tanacetum coccineum]